MSMLEMSLLASLDKRLTESYDNYDLILVQLN